MQTCQKGEGGELGYCLKQEHDIQQGQIQTVLLPGWTNPSDGTGWGLMGWTAGLGGSWQWWGYMNQHGRGKCLSHSASICYTTSTILCPALASHCKRDINKLEGHGDGQGWSTCPVRRSWGVWACSAQNRETEEGPTAVPPIIYQEVTEKGKPSLLKFMAGEHSAVVINKGQSDWICIENFLQKDNYRRPREAVQFPSFKGLKPTWVRP